MNPAFSFFAFFFQNVMEVHRPSALGTIKNLRGNAVWALLKMRASPIKRHSFRYHLLI